LQSKNTDTDIEDKHMDTKGEGEGGMNREIGIDIYTHTLKILHIKQITNENLLYTTMNYFSVVT